MHTHRWTGRTMTDWELIDYTLTRLRNVPVGQRTARFRVALVFHDGSITRVVTGESVGAIVLERPTECIPGYPFRSLFYLPEFGKLYKDLTREELLQVSHRVAALRQLAPRIIERLQE